MNLLIAADVTLPEWLAADVDVAVPDLLIGVRPESISVSKQVKDLSIASRVTGVEYEGSLFLIHLISPSGTRFILSHTGESVPNLGDEVVVGWDRTATHLFSKSTGDRVLFKT